MTYMVHNRPALRCFDVGPWFEIIPQFELERKRINHLVEPFLLCRFGTGLSNFCTSFRHISTSYSGLSFPQHGPYGIPGPASGNAVLGGQVG